MSLIIVCIAITWFYTHFSIFCHFTLSITFKTMWQSFIKLEYFFPKFINFPKEKTEFSQSEFSQREITAKISYYTERHLFFNKATMDYLI